VDPKKKVAKAAKKPKEATVRVRVTPEQRSILASAAARAGLDLSAWLRYVGLQEAKVQT
jgi:uncharacterized protein (DUF1778 family)